MDKKEKRHKNLKIEINKKKKIKYLLEMNKYKEKRKEKNFYLNFFKMMFCFPQKRLQVRKKKLIQ